MLGYEVCVLSGSVGKAANLGVPDIVLSNMSDVVDHPEDIMWTLLRPILL
jgi:2-methylisocitrate lyase-like PEP mutase family enzyme